MGRIPECKQSICNLSNHLTDEAKTNIDLFPEDRQGEFFFPIHPAAALIFFNLIYTISQSLYFCKKMVFLNISERCLKINITSTYVRGHHMKSLTVFSPVYKTSLWFSFLLFNLAHPNKKTINSRIIIVCMNTHIKSFGLVLFMTKALFC